MLKGGRRSVTSEVGHGVSMTGGRKGRKAVSIDESVILLPTHILSPILLLYHMGRPDYGRRLWYQTMGRNDRKGRRRASHDSDSMWSLCLQMCNTSNYKALQPMSHGGPSTRPRTICHPSCNIYKFIWRCVSSLWRGGRVCG